MFRYSREHFSDLVSRGSIYVEEEGDYRLITEEDNDGRPLFVKLEDGTFEPYAYFGDVVVETDEGESEGEGDWWEGLVDSSRSGDSGDGDGVNISPEQADSVKGINDSLNILSWWAILDLFERK